MPIYPGRPNTTQGPYWPHTPWNPFRSFPYIANVLLYAVIWLVPLPYMYPCVIVWNGTVIPIFM